MPPAVTTSRRASATWSTSPCRRPARSPPGISTSCAAGAPTRSPTRLKAAGHGAKAYYRTPVHRQPAMLEYAAGAELPVTDELARTHLAIPMSPVLSAQMAGEVVAAARTAG